MPTLDWLERDQAITAADRGFWLPTSRGRFFPDFVAELVDGRLAVIEYKGAHLRNDAYEIEKRQVGELWAARSAGGCLFRFVYLDDAGQSMSQQINQIFEGARPQ